MNELQPQGIVPSKDLIKRVFGLKEPKPVVKIYDRSSYVSISNKFVSSFEIIARSFNATDMIVLHLTDGREFAIPFRSKPVGTGMLLYTNADGTSFWLKMPEDR